MNPTDITNQIKAYLEADITLSSYIQKVYRGVRANIPDANYPCIILEPVSNEEDDNKDVNTLQRVTLSLVISAYMRTNDLDAQLVGDGQNIKGIFDLEKDIKVALSAYYPNLGTNCIWFKFRKSLYDIEMFPIRGVHIPMDIYYQQNILTRT